MATELLEKSIVVHPPIEIANLDEDIPESGELFLLEYPGEKHAAIALRVEPGDAIAVFSSPNGARRLIEWIEQSGGKVQETTLDAAAEIALSKPANCIGVALVDDIDNPKLLRRVK